MSSKSESTLEKKLYIVKSLEPDTKITDNDQNKVVYAWDYFASKILSQRFVKHQICDKILSFDEMSEIDSTALKIATTWHQNKTIRDTLTYDGINLGFLVEWETFHYLIQTIKNYVMLEKILEKENPDKVIIFGDIGSIGTILDKKHLTHELKESKKDNSKFIMDYIEIKYDVFNHPISFKISLQKFFWMKKQYETIIRFILNIVHIKRKNTI